MQLCRQMPFMISIYLLPNFMQVWGGDYMGSLDKPGRAVDYIWGSLDKPGRAVSMLLPFPSWSGESGEEC